MTNLQPGTTVKDRAGIENFGLLMSVLDEQPGLVKVSYINLDGFYQEGWLERERVEVVPVTLKNPAMY